MKYDEFEKLEQTHKKICGFIQELQLRPNERQMVVCLDRDNYWLLNADVTNEMNIPIATWHSDKDGIVNPDYEFNDWHSIVVWLFEKYTGCGVTSFYNEYM